MDKAKYNPLAVTTLMEPEEEAEEVQRIRSRFKAFIAQSAAENVNPFDFFIWEVARLESVIDSLKKHLAEQGLWYKEDFEE